MEKSFFSLGDHTSYICIPCQCKLDYLPARRARNRQIADRISTLFSRSYYKSILNSDITIESIAWLASSMQLFAILLTLSFLYSFSPDQEIIFLFMPLFYSSWIWSKVATIAILFVILKENRFLCVPIQFQIDDLNINRQTNTSEKTREGAEINDKKFLTLTSNYVEA